MSAGDDDQPRTSSYDEVEGRGGPLGALANLSSLPRGGGLSPLPPLPGEDGGEWMSSRVVRKQREAARDARTADLTIEFEIDLALFRARHGWLKADWRARGLDDAMASQRSGDIWRWMKIEGFARHYWEPGVAAAYGLPWDEALGSWRADTLMCKRTQEMLDGSSVSRWAGFNVVDATPDIWESLLDNGHVGPWPSRAIDGPSTHGVHAHALLQALDRVEFSYEGGLAAGGRDVDWLGRHGERVRRWRFTADRDRDLAEIDRIARNIEPAGMLHDLCSLLLVCV